MSSLALGAEVRHGWNRTPPSLRVVVQRLQMYIHLVILFVNFRVIIQLIHQDGLRTNRGIRCRVIVAAPSCKIFSSSLRYNFILASETINRSCPIDILVSDVYAIPIRVGVA